MWNIHQKLTGIFHTLIKSKGETIKCQYMNHLEMIFFVNIAFGCMRCELVEFKGVRNCKDFEECYDLEPYYEALRKELRIEKGKKNK